MKLARIRILATFGFLLVGPAIAFAQSPTIQFPIAELGNCASEEACAAYCDDSAHLDECVSFAEEHNLLNEEEIERAKEFQGQTGPGGCRGANECRVFCDDPSHQEECVEFAHRKGLISDRDAEVSRRVAREGGPGGCRGQRECRTYCDDPSHIDECLSFAEKNGFISGEEAARIKKAGLVSGPGGCRGETCRDYCEDPAHQNECIDFAVANGFMTAEEAALAKKFAGKTGPGGCRGEECRTYCENPQNAEACFEFAAAEGLIPPQELERARKFLRISQEGGPGGCRGEACRDYCEDPAHQDECFDFAKKQGLIRPEDERNFEIGKKLNEKLREAGGPGGCKTDNECRIYCGELSHAEECVAFAAAHGGVSKEEAERMLKEFTERRFEGRGEFRPPEDFRRFEEEAKKRFEEFRQLEEQFRKDEGEFPGPGSFQQPRGFGPSGGFSGPGGCQDPAECIKYCAEHKEECFSFGPAGQPSFRPPEGGIPPGLDAFPLRPDVQLPPGEIIPGKTISPFPTGEPKPIGAICPAMPTIESCPVGQQKVVAFSSPECGTYYTCKPDESASAPRLFQYEDPAAQCSAQGGTWDGSACQLRNVLDEAAKECASRGGEWRQEERQCYFKEYTPLPSSRVPGGFLANFLYIFR